MTLSKSAAASILALGLFLLPAMVTAQAQEAAATTEAAPAELIEAANTLINDRRASSELTDDELKQRSRQTRQLIRNKSLPEELKSQLQAIFESDRAELDTRASAAKSPEPQPEPAQEAAPQPEPQQQPVQESAPQPEPQPEPVQEATPLPEPQQQPVEEAAPQPEPAPSAEIPQAVTDLLNDGRSVEELSDADLAARVKIVRQQSKNQALPSDVRKKLVAIGRQARGAIEARQKAAASSQPETTDTPAPVSEQPAPQPQAEPAPAVNTTPDPKAAETQPPATPPAVDKVEANELDGNAGDPEAEKKARAFLEDPATAESLNDEALRTRLDGMRDLMAENELSQKTERALRNKLRAEREVLRARIAKAKAEEEAKAAAAKAEEDKKKQQAAAEAGQQPAPKKDKKPNINIIITAETPMDEILRDRRRAEELDESELRYRVRAWRQFESSDRFREFDEDQRSAWRERTRRDREFLGERLRADRNIRRVELEKPSNIRRIVIEDDQDFAMDDIPEDIFAAEVEDEDIERALLAPPRRKIARKISVEEIAAQPKARAALTRIEVDTIRFGFNEAFVREEEVDNLDQIASVIERVLKKYPREVFLIEGHTDAVGSDPYNDKLSKARAEAVKKALATYYVIPAKNLKTVGLGERYLKIPTAEAEQENRRVSISRATAVVGEADE